MSSFPKVLTTLLDAATRVVLAQLRGFGSTGDDDNAAADDDAEVVTPLGYHSRPLRSATVEAVMYRDGDDCVVIAILDKGLPPLTDADCDEGEVLIYGPAEPSATIKITRQGDVIVTPKSGRNVLIGGPGANSPVASEGSQTAGHVHTVLFSLVAGATPVTGSITVASSTDIIAVGSGAPHVKVVPT